jgi:hypothetical protein
VKSVTFWYLHKKNLCNTNNFHNTHITILTNMHPYLIHLLEDIAKAKRPGYKEYDPIAYNYNDEEKDIDESNSDSLDEYLMEMERYVSEDPPSTFGDYCGLKVSDFPPSEQLTEEDMQVVIEAFKKMSYTWNLDFSFPETLPTPIFYKIMVDTLDEKTWIVSSGTVSFDYCSGNPEGCKFGEYCNCLKYWQEDELGDA